MAKGIDVLNELRKFERTYILTGLQEEAAAISRIFAAVAELIEADKRLDAAQTAYNRASAGNMRNDLWGDVMGARDRRAAALDRAQGA